MRNQQPATITLIVINALAFAWLLLTGNPASASSLLLHGALDGGLVQRGQWWRIVTGAFLHGGWLHIAFNMFALYQVGTFVEYVAGTWRMLAVYAIAMVGSGLAVVYYTPNDVTVGASGAIFGLFGALVAIGIRLGKQGRSLIGQTLPIIVINLVIGFSLPNISNAGHIGGLICGFIAGLVILSPPRQPEVQPVEAAPVEQATVEEARGA